MAPSDSPDNDTTQATSKRRRVAVACDACRTRKSRCDGSRPRCELCSDLGFECIYTPPTTATNVIVQKDYLHGLEERVKKLEESFASVRGDVDGLVAREKGAGVGRGEDGRAAPDLIGTEDEVDAMGAVTFADEEDSGFFGILETNVVLRPFLILNRSLVQHCFIEAFVSRGGSAGVSFIPWCCGRWLCQCFTATFSGAEENWPGCTITGQYLCLASPVRDIGSNSEVLLKYGAIVSLHIPTGVLGNVSSDGTGKLYQSPTNMAWLIEHGPCYVYHYCCARWCQSGYTDCGIGCFLPAWSRLVWERDSERDNSGSW